MMGTERIADIAQYDRLLAAADEKGAKNINAYLLPGEIEELVREEALFFEENTSGILFYRQGGRFWKLYLYTNPQTHFTVSRQEKPIITEFLAARALPEKLSPVIETLTANGFNHALTSKRMSIDTAALCDKLQAETLGVCSVGLAEAAHKEEILHLWEEIFDPVTNQLPSAEELPALIRGGRILRAFSPEEETTGVMFADIQGGCGWIRHQAVAPRFRGRRIGMALSARFAETMREKGIGRCCLWVREKDEQAIGFHSRTGFQFDGRVSVEYISY